MNRFDAWETRNLAKFAEDAAARLAQQYELIESLQADLKTALRAYRHLVIEGAKNEVSSVRELHRDHR
jgi:dethiobiotin synthetase